MNHAVCLQSPSDRRVVFAIPWGERVVLGTTDTFFDGDYDQVACEQPDVDYLLGLANRYFPDADLVPDDVVGAYAGLRPLVGPDDPDVGASQISREHMIRVDPDGLITVAGGKLTTYRSMAAEVLGVVAKRLKAEGVHVGGCQTGSVLLPGGAGIRFKAGELVSTGPGGADAAAEVREHLGGDVTEHLQQTYGGGWLEVAALAAHDTDLARRIVPDLPYIWAEVDHAVADEMVMTLRDFMRRRTQLEIRDLRQSWSVAPALADRIGAKLGWSHTETDAQVDSWKARAALSMAWRGDVED